MNTNVGFLKLEFFYKTTDGGNSWVRIPVADNPNQFLFTSETNGWCINNDQLLKTTDVG